MNNIEKQFVEEMDLALGKRGWKAAALSCYGCNTVLLIFVTCRVCRRLVYVGMPEKGRRDGGLEALVWQPETVGLSLSQEEVSAASSRPRNPTHWFFASTAL